MCSGAEQGQLVSEHRGRAAFPARRTRARLRSPGASAANWSQTLEGHTRRHEAARDLRSQGSHGTAGQVTQTWGRGSPTPAVCNVPQGSSAPVQKAPAPWAWNQMRGGQSAARTPLPDAPGA